MREQYDENLLLDYLEGQLDDDQRAEVEQWLRDDPALADLLSQMAADRESVRSLSEPEPPAWVMEEVDQQLERSMLLDQTFAADDEEQALRRHAMGRWVGYGALAASLLLTGAIVYYSFPGFFPETLRLNGDRGAVARDADPPPAENQSAESGPTDDASRAPGTGTDTGTGTGAASDHAEAEAGNAVAPDRSNQDAAGPERAARSAGESDPSHPSDSVGDSAPAAVGVEGRAVERGGEADLLDGSVEGGAVGPSRAEEGQPDRAAEVERDRADRDAAVAEASPKRPDATSGLRGSVLSDAAPMNETRFGADEGQSRGLGWALPGRGALVNGSGSVVLRVRTRDAGRTFEQLHALPGDVPEAEVHPPHPPRAAAATGAGDDTVSGGDDTVLETALRLPRRALPSVLAVMNSPRNQMYQRAAVARLAPEADAASEGAAGDGPAGGEATGAGNAARRMIPAPRPSLVPDYGSILSPHLAEGEAEEVIRLPVVIEIEPASSSGTSGSSSEQSGQ